MKEKKNIDRLFQEKFKDFESHPSDRVWNNILTAQNKKEHKKIIPIWWKMGGVAATLIILFGIGNLLMTTGDQDNNNPLVEIQSSDIKNNIIQDKTATTTTSSQKLNASKDINPLVSTNESKATLSQGNNTRPASALSTTTGTKNNAISNTSSVNNGATDPLNSTQLTTAEKNPKLIAYQESPPQQNTKTTNNQHDNNLVTPISVDSEQENTNAISHTAITAENTKNLVEEAQKIEALQEDKLTEIKDKAIVSRWDVGAVAAPVYYGDFGGSGLDKQFADNDKSGDVNLSYGVQVSYALSPKLKIRTGVSNVDLSYSTNEISFSTNGLGRRVRGITFTDNAKTLAIVDHPVAQNSLAANSVIPNIGITSNGSLQQQLSYVEVPLEAIYVVSDKRVGLSLIGGVSTLFLNENDVVLKSSQLTTSLGTANGVNEVSFTTNIGIGLDYKVTKKVIFNIEPSLKYQLNSFDNTVVDFQPYYLGLYTGVSYKF